ncbi:MAG: sulfite exporter TauE/SafE family protein [Chloroflexota bacterium]|mgnify:FL=1|nr:MAG: hypothetical protein DIU68_17520 [Chloroflexota bacterium]
MAFILIVALSSLLIGLSKGGMGAALVVLVTPILTQVMPVADAVSLSLPLLIIADVFALWAYWKTWDMHYIRLMLPLAILGIGVGTFLLASLPDDVLRRLLGVFTLVFVAYRLLSAHLQTARYQPRDWHGYLAGAASGLGSALANTGAPPFTAYMLLQDVSPPVFVGTTTLFFALVNLIKVPWLVAGHLLDLSDLTRILWAMPLIPVGIWLGRWLVNRMNREVFERVMLYVLALAGLALLLLEPR